MKKETRAQLAQALTDNMLTTIKVENNAFTVSSDRKALNNERARIVTGYGDDFSALVTDLGESLAAFPVGSDVLKARKQTWKRSFATAFKKVHDGLELSFTEDTPVVGNRTVKAQPTNEEKVTAVLAAIGLNGDDTKTILSIVNKALAEKAVRIERKKSEAMAILAEEKGQTIAALKAKLAELEKQA